MRYRTALGIACATLGAVLLVASMASHGETPVAAAQPASADVEYPADRLARIARAAEAAAAPPALADGWRVVVPRLGIDLPLRDGDLLRDVASQKTPTGAAFRMPGSALPGSAGNLYVYSHARTGMFLSLWNVRLGDVVEIDTPPGGALRYVVAEIHPRVATTDITYLVPTDDERLTLQTSTGPNVGDPRFVVIARRAP